jgi:hypothetical protein
VAGIVDPCAKTKFSVPEVLLSHDG